MTRGTPVSAHLVWEEICCGCHRRGCADGCTGGALDPAVADLFERIRASCSSYLGRDCPIRVSSGIRCPAHNRRVGGAAESAHLEGKALDLLCPEGLSLEIFWAVCGQEAGDGGFGKYHWGAHVDTRTHPPCRRWSVL